MSKVSKTDWQRLSSMDDQAIDTSDIPELDDIFFSDGRPESTFQTAGYAKTGFRCSGLV